MPIVPDTSDWTWVLERPCPACKFRAREVAVDDLPRLIRENATAWPAVLARADVAVRPDDHTWSPLEYAAHVRDVCRLFDERLRRILDEEDPLLANWDQDATAVLERYADETVVLPGHGPATTIGRERASNPFLLEAAGAAPTRGW